MHEILGTGAGYFGKHRFYRIVIISARLCPRRELPSGRNARSVDMGVVLESTI